MESKKVNKIKLVSLMVGGVISSSLLLTGCGGGGGGSTAPSNATATSTTLQSNSNNVNVGVTGTATLAIVNTGTITAQGLQAQVTGFNSNDVQVDASACSSVAPGATCSISVTTDDKVATGTGLVTITGTNVSNSVAVPLIISENVAFVPQPTRTHMFEYGVQVQNNQKSGAVLLNNMDINIADQSVTLATTNPDDNTPLCENDMLLQAGQSCEIWLTAAQNVGPLGIEIGQLTLGVQRGGSYQINQTLMIDKQNALYVAGKFNTIGNQSLSNVAMWDGSSWQALDTSGVNGEAYTMATTTKGDLYFGGSFTRAGSIPSAGIVRFDGEHFQTMPALDNVIVRKLLTNQAGDSILYAGGMVNTDSTGFVSKLDGGVWQNMGAFGGRVNDMTYYNNTLYAVGNFEGGVSAYQNNAWGIIGNPSYSGRVNAILNNGGSLYVALGEGSGGDLAALNSSGYFMSVAAGQINNEVFRLVPQGQNGVLAMGNFNNFFVWNNNALSSTGSVPLPVYAYAAYSYDEVAGFFGGGFNYVGVLNNAMDASPLAYLGESGDEVQDLKIVPTLTVILPTKKRS